MIHVICEDINSARDFWGLLIKNFTTNFTFDDVENAGNNTLKFRLMTQLNSCKKGDAIFIAFDNVSNSTFNVALFLQDAKIECEKRNIILYYTTYFCFEEVFLSYKYLSRLIVNDVEIVEFIKDKIYANEDYFETNYVSDWLCDDKSESLDKEKFCNRLLSKITSSIKGDFTVTKETGCLYGKGSCWLYDCSDIQEKWNNHHKILNICNSCLYEKNQKITEFINNSILFKFRFIEYLLKSTKKTSVQQVYSFLDTMNSF